MGPFIFHYAITGNANLFQKREACNFQLSESGDICLYKCREIIGQAKSAKKCKKCEFAFFFILRKMKIMQKMQIMQLAYFLPCLTGGWGGVGQATMSPGWRRGGRGYATNNQNKNCRMLNFWENSPNKTKKTQRKFPPISQYFCPIFSPHRMIFYYGKSKMAVAIEPAQSAPNCLHCHCFDMLGSTAWLNPAAGSLVFFVAQLDPMKQWPGHCPGRALPSSLVYKAPCRYPASMYVP